MMRCTICNKFIMPPIYTVSSTDFSKYCQCSTFGYTHTFNEAIACTPEQIDAHMRQWAQHFFHREPQQPEEVQPLEWADVEAQLDALMAELNRGKS